MNSVQKFLDLLENGEKLKDFLKDNDIDISVIARRLGKSRTTIYNWLDSNTHLDKIFKASGVQIDNSVKQKNSGDGTSYNLNNSTINTDEEIKALKKDIERLEAIIKSKDETIAALKLLINK